MTRCAFPGYPPKVKRLQALPLLAALGAICLSGCAALDELLANSDSDPQVIYVREPSAPVYFDPYFNQPKFYRPPQYSYETTKKTKNGKVTKTETIRNEYGQTIYKEKTTRPEKKKKK